MIKVEGEHTTAVVMGISEEDVGQDTLAQIKQIADHEAFRNPVRVMPDCHPGKGSVIGFTMVVGERIVPNVIGVDIGCGMIAVKLTDKVDDLDITREEIDERVRARVPMGWGRAGVEAPERDYHHLVNDFPWESLNERLETFVEQVDEPYVAEMERFLDEGGYDGKDYFDDLLERAQEIKPGLNAKWVIDQVGTLGSGNHFIELTEAADSGDNWVVVHSGSRGIGENIAKYWQKQAIDVEEMQREWRREQVEEAKEICSEYPDDYVMFDFDEDDDKDIVEWLQGGKGEDFVNFDSIPEQQRESVRLELKRAVPEGSAPEPDLDESLDYLEGDEAAGYLIDMLFCQEYALWNRTKMAETVADAIGSSVDETVHARHNVVDFRDGVIRKGATRAYEGELAVVPFNMQAGTLLVEGKSNEDWNRSVCHGAGRVMSRRKAEDQFDSDDIGRQMDEVDAYASELPADEAPGAYKDTDLIEDAIEDTAEVVDRLEVLVNFKAPE